MTVSAKFDTQKSRGQLTSREMRSRWIFNEANKCPLERGLDTSHDNSRRAVLVALFLQGAVEVSHLAIGQIDLAQLNAFCPEEIGERSQHTLPLASIFAANEGQGKASLKGDNETEKFVEFGGPLRLHLPVHLICWLFSSASFCHRRDS